MPKGWYAQESRFVPRRDGESEDDGWLLTYVFDEGQLDVVTGEVRVDVDVRSELWVIDAKGMREVVCRVVLPQRVPYGLHGNWFSEDEVLGQRAVERFREVPSVSGVGKTRIGKGGGLLGGAWMRVRRWLLGRLG